MTIKTNLRPTTLAVRDDGAVYTASGMRLSPDEVRAQTIAYEAGRWAAFASERARMRPETVTQKALEATAFSVLRGASSFAVPTKLAGTSEHQRALWALVHDRVRPWAALEVSDTGDGLDVSYGDDRLGEIQPKHVGWVRPLVPFGARVYLARVTGHDSDGYTLGANVVLGHVGAALGRLDHALGAGDGAASATPALRLVVPDAARDGGPVREDGPADVVLYRDVTGAPHASVTTDGPVDWGRDAAPGAALALARAVLAHVADDGVADALAPRFAEVVRALPFAGGLVRATSVEIWIERTSRSA